MVERESQRKSPSRDDEAVEGDASEVTAPAAQDEALDDDVDAILDEIDEVLEVNAAEFVQGFVQKGGQ